MCNAPAWPRLATQGHSRQGNQHTITSFTATHLSQPDRIAHHSTYHDPLSAIVIRATQLARLETANYYTWRSTPRNYTGSWPPNIRRRHSAQGHTRSPTPLQSALHRCRKIRPAIDGTIGSLPTFRQTIAATAGLDTSNYMHACIHAHYCEPRRSDHHDDDRVQCVYVYTVHVGA